MLFKIKSETSLGKKFLEKGSIGSFEIDKDGLFRCTFEEILPICKEIGSQSFTLIEGKSFEYIRNYTNKIEEVCCVQEEHVKGLNEEVKVLVEEILTYSLDQVREISKVLNYIPAQTQGVKQIVKKFEGREQEFLDLLKETYPKQ